MSARGAADEMKSKRANPNGLKQLEILTFAEMLEPNLDSRSLVKGILETSAIALIYGQSGCGKTFFTLDLVLHIALGHEWFGRRVARGRVVYVAAEAGRSIRNRVAAFARAKRKQETEVDFSAVVSPVDLCHLEPGSDVDRLTTAIGSAQVVVIDTVSRALAGGNENAPDDMGAFVRALDQLRERLGCTIIAVHHIGKDPSRGGRGHSLLHCAVDTEIEVERQEGGLCIATVKKQRDGPGGGQIVFVLQPVELGRDQHGDPVTSCVIVTTDYVPEVKGPTGQPKEALAVLNQAVAEKGEIYRSEGIEFRAVKVEVWREYLERSRLFGEGQKLRTAWSRVRRKLTDDGHIGLKDGFAWPTRPEPPL